MRRAAWTAAALLAAAAALFLFRGREADERPALEPLLPGIAAVPDSITIRNDSLDFKAVPGNGLFRQLRPVEDWADLEQVVPLLSFLRGAGVLRIVERNAPDPGRYGLADPRAVVGVDTVAVRLGDTNPLGDGVYASVGRSGDVLLVGRGFELFTRLGPGRLRDRVPIRFPLRDLRRMVVEAGGKTTTVVREGAGNWRVAEFSMRADPIATWRIARLLADARIHSFAESEGTWPAEPAARVELAWPNGAGTLELGGIVPGTALRRARSDNRNGDYFLPARLADSLSLHADVMVDRRLFRMATSSATAVRVVSAEVDYSVDRAGGEGWIVTDRAGGTRAVAPHLIRAFLRNVVEARAVGEIPPAMAEGLFRETATLAVNGETVALDTREPSAPLARRSGERGILAMGSGFWQALRVRADDLAAVP